MDMMRWRYGDTNPVVSAVGANTVIEIGDLVWQDGNVAKPASDIPDQKDKHAAQAAFAAKFLGVAMQRSHRGEVSNIRVATTGVFEFDCPSGIFELGELMGTNVGGRNKLLSQEAAKVEKATEAIGRVAKYQHALTVSVLVDIRSTVMTGGVLPR